MCPREEDRRQAGQGSLGAVVVVAVPPIPGPARGLIQAGEHEAP